MHFFQIYKEISELLFQFFFFLSWKGKKNKGVSMQAIVVPLLKSHGMFVVTFLSAGMSRSKSFEITG